MVNWNHKYLKSISNNILLALELKEYPIAVASLIVYITFFLTKKARLISVDFDAKVVGNEMVNMETMGKISNFCSSSYRSQGFSLINIRTKEK